MPGKVSHRAAAKSNRAKVCMFITELSSSMFSKFRSYPQISSGVHVLFLSLRPNSWSTDFHIQFTIKKIQICTYNLLSRKTHLMTTARFPQYTCLEPSDKLNRPDGIKATN